MRARNPLYIMAKPPPEVQARIVALPRNDPSRGPELLHVTLLSLFDLHYAPPDWLPVVIGALESFDGQAFPLAFDRIENRKAVTLRTRAPLAEARAFQKALVNHLLHHKPPMLLGTTPEPHVTINYRGDRQGAQKIAPIGWAVEDLAHRKHRRQDNARRTWPLASARERRLTAQGLRPIHHPAAQNSCGGTA